MSVPQIPQQQAVPQSAPTNDEQISLLARETLDQITSDENTSALDPDEQAPVETPPETETPTEAAEPEAETPALPEVPMVEVEVDGEKFTIPEKVKHRVMADKDYRQKTMEVAATKKQLEALTATAQKLNEQAQQMAPYHAQLFQMESRAQELSKALQSQELQSDPLTFNRVQGELAILLHNKDRLAAGLNQQVQRLSQEQQQLRQQQLAVDAPKLFERVPELQKPETQKKLAQYVQDAGLPEEAIDYLNYSAVGTELVWKAHQYDQMVKDQATAAAKLKEKVKTLPSATQSSRAADSGAKDKQLRAQWQKGGGKITDPNFDALLRSKLRG
jgi:hypothetical protein